MIVIIAPPPKVAYPFMLNLEEYPQQIINFFIVIVRDTVHFLLSSSILNLILGLVLAEIQKAECNASFQRQVVSSEATAMS